MTDYSHKTGLGTVGSKITHTELVWVQWTYDGQITHKELVGVQRMSDYSHTIFLGRVMV